MSDANPYDGSEGYSEPSDPPTMTEQREPGSRLNVATVLASAGVAAIVSALIVTIGVVGLATSDRFAGSNPQATPTVVNLGAAQTPGVQGPVPAAGIPTSTPDGAVPTTENVPESDGGTGTGGTTQSAAPTAGTTTQPATAAAPTALTPGQLNTKIKLIMNTGASRSARADELEGGAQALSSVDQVAEMLRVSGAGFSYKMNGPVQVSGTTMSATLQMSLVGNGSRYKQLSWVWTGGKWKLSNASVCVIAAYAMLKCSV
ncbi:MAG: hypothetical protein LBE07_03805 [Gordonia sp. (in: high G+C Gram-positive bacteria)]|jgi:hypothetical protein|nr:hypothetical protein [Gordonia sp. (in: high G+C Gram-positive bacteria)]